MRERSGIAVCDKNPDINLVFIDGIRKGCKNIFRLDGVWMNTDVKFRHQNAKILRTIRQCDGVVYQNRFCRNAAEKFLGHFNGVEILNGAPLGRIYKPFNHQKPYIVAAARWRPHKRLSEVIAGFINSDLRDKYDLVVLGEPDSKKIKHNNVVYLGKQDNDKVMSVISSSEFAVHLAWIDWCPNFVVESLSLRKNILHTACGGTKYVVQGCGIEIDEPEWNFKPTRLYKPPKLDSNLLVNAYNAMLNLPAPNPVHIDIRSVAQQYIDYCEKILND